MLLKEDQSSVIPYQEMSIQGIRYIVYTAALSRKYKISVYEKLQCARHQAKHCMYIISFIITILKMKTQQLNRLHNLSHKGKVKGIYFKNQYFCYKIFLE